MRDAAIRALIIDDEPIARADLRDLIGESEEVLVVGEAASGQEAVGAIRMERPDLIFLDIQMPEMDGFEVLTHLDPASLPLIIFVTAHDSHALKAFEANALDYLLKPFGRPRFRKALDRAVERIRSRDLEVFEERLKALVDRMKSDRPPLTRLMVRSRGRVFFLRTDEIRFIEAAGNYAALHALHHRQPGLHPGDHPAGEG